MRLREIIDSPCGLRYMLETLPLSSGYALNYMLESELLSEREAILKGYSQVKKYLPVLEGKNAKYLSSLQHKLFTLKDIGRTISRVESGEPVDDIELFEIKHCLILSLDVARLLSECSIEEFGLECEKIEELLALLDPDGHRIDTFYIYDSYSVELSRIRQQIAIAEDIDKLSELRFYEQELERGIREDICRRLSSGCYLIRKVLDLLVNIDINIAKGVQMRELSLSFPSISESSNGHFEGLFHPYVESLLAKEGGEFTPVDIVLDERPILIIGANMGGKTVALKSMTLSYYLMGLSMGIPAKSASIPLKERIFFISGDAQNLSTGLSSFAAEIKSIDEVLVAAQDSSKRIVAFIDEPARSTNPVEGTALVLSLINVLKRRGVSLILTTHYNIHSSDCLRYRVRGIVDGKMDYRLCQTSDNEVPHEALAVAESLNISAEWIAEAKKLLTV